MGVASKRPAVVTAVTAAVVLAGAWLRLVHLGTPSLWWDEVVHIATASRPSVWAVLQEVKLGIPPGAGNAGAVPLDYVALHAWLALVPRAIPPHLEAYYRLPACLYAIVALALMPGLARRLAGPTVGLVATVLFAGSIPHVLYAAEVRSYSLFALMSVLNMRTFLAVAEGSASRGAWGRYAVVGVLYVFTGLPALVPLGLQWAVLALRRSVAGVGAGLVTGLLALAYLWGTRVGVRYGRPAHATLDPLVQTLEALRFFAGGNDVVVVLSVIGVGVLFARAWRRRALLGVLALAAGFVAVPLVVEAERVKEYYFHPRHVLFLLPAFVVFAAAGLDACVRGGLGLLKMGSGGVAFAVGLAAAAALVAPGVSRFLAQPQLVFARTKTIHDFAAVMPALARRVLAMPPDARHLLVAERDSVANAVAAFYLRAWGIAGRVSFHGTRDVAGTLRGLWRGCGTRCAGVKAEALRHLPGMTVAVGLTPRFRGLLGIRPVGPWPVEIGGYTVLAYGQVPPVPGFTRRPLPGVTVFAPMP